jgi:hypothetical protein
MTTLATSIVSVPYDSGFDYTTLSPEAAASIRETAAIIRSRMKKSIIETGRDLIEVKAMLEHGQFGCWLDAEFGMTGRTARNYMNAVAVADAKPEMISVLSSHRDLQACLAEHTPHSHR